MPCELVERHQQQPDPRRVISTLSSSRAYLLRELQAVRSALLLKSHRA